jgi:hypothetical protein
MVPCARASRRDDRASRELHAVLGWRAVPILALASGSSLVL